MLHTVLRMTHFQGLLDIGQSTLRSALNVTKRDDQPPRPFIIGVTGNIACGKSTVMAELARLGAETIDADAVYHELIAPDAPLWKPLIAHFGDEIVGEDNQIDRRVLGEIVFADSRQLEVLERLTHPAIREEIERRIMCAGADIVAIDAVKLIEGGLHRSCDSVWLVICPADQQIERLMARNSLSQAEARKRIAIQPAVEPKLRVAGVVIDNSGSIIEAVQQVQAAWSRLKLESESRTSGE